LVWIVGGIAKASSKKKPGSSQAPQRSWEEIIRDLSAGQQTGAPPPPPSRTPSQPTARSPHPYRNVAATKPPATSSQRPRVAVKQAVRFKVTKTSAPPRQATPKSRQSKRPAPSRAIAPPPLPSRGQTTTSSEIVTQPSPID